MAHIEEADTVIEGRRIHYGVAGDGPALLLVPGNSMSMQRWVEVGYVEALAGDFTVITFDPLGHGQSEKTSDRSEYARARLNAHLVGVLDAVGVDRASVWGYSRGAFMTSVAVNAHPDRFDRAVIGGIPLFDSIAVARGLGLARDEAEYDAAFAKSAQGDWAAFWSVFPIQLPEDVRAMLESKNDLGSITAATWAIRRDPIVFSLSEVPTLAYWGDGERFAALNAETALALGDSLVTAIVPGGHPEAFGASDTVLAAVRPFLS